MHRGVPCIIIYVCFGLTEIFRLMTDIEWKNKPTDCVFYKWESQAPFLNFILSVTENCAGGFENERACSITVTCFCRHYVMPSQNISHEIKFISYYFHNSPWPHKEKWDADTVSTSWSHHFSNEKVEGAVVCLNCTLEWCRSTIGQWTT